MLSLEALHNLVILETYILQLYNRLTNLIMQRAFFILTFFVVVSSTVFGQESPELTNTQVRATFLPLGISLEQKVGGMQTIAIAAGLQVSFYAYSDTFAGSGSEFFLAPFISAEFRNYYARRRVKKKDLGVNSGNYVALAAGRVMERIGGSENSFLLNSQENSSFVGPVWGMQRNYASGFHLNFSIGLGYQSGDYFESGIGFIGTGGLGLYFK